MADRSDLPKIKPEGQPSLLNHEMGEGAFWGNTAGGLATLATPPKYGTAVVLGATAVGGLIGGVQGKNKQEQEQQHGKTVKSPGYFNKGIISGMMGGYIIGLPFQFFAKGSAKSLTAVAILIGMAVGSIMRKNELQRDFDRAVAVRTEETNALQSQLRAAQLTNNTPPISYKNSVSADEAAELAEKHAHKESSHAEKAHHTAAEAELAEAGR